MVSHLSEHFVPWCLPHEPQLTPICIGFLENMDNIWYRYFFTEYILKISSLLDVVSIKPADSDGPLLCWLTNCTEFGDSFDLQNQSRALVLIPSV